MIIRWALILASTIAFGPHVPVAIAQDTPKVLVRTSISAPSVMIGETIKLDVDILTDTFFTAAPEVPDLSISGVIARLSEGRQVHLNETVQGTAMFGVRRTYELTPIAVADVEIPAFDVIAHPGPPGTPPITSTTAVQRVRVTAPPGAENSFVTHGLAIAQHFDADLSKLKVGDAFTRTIEITATGTPGMFIPDVEVAEIDGLNAYPQTPLLKDTSPDEPLVGKRIFAVSYIVQEAGDYELPSVSIPWWNIDTKQSATADIPAVSFHAIAAPPPPAPFAVPKDEVVATPATQIHWRTISMWIGIGVALVLLAWWLRPHAMHWMHSLADRRRVRHERYLDSEAFAYAQLRKSLGEGAGDDVPAALYRWIDRLPGPAGTTPHRLAATRDHEFIRACEKLLDLRYAQPGSADSSEVLGQIGDRLGTARAQILQRANLPRSNAKSLPEMNPA